ncbi:hypothetical protein ACFWFZ_21715 [Streptomyces sp. NPDC060232]|uniref:hypothetical protein n=1 Tax=Streptomyces sp. NPDC060232 TaxID=3347079 RepID=UPI003668F724
MSEVGNISDAPPSPPPPAPPVDARAAGDGDVPNDGHGDAGARSTGDQGRDEMSDGDLPKLGHTAEERPDTPTEDLADGDVGKQETTVDQPAAEPLPAGQAPPGGNEPPRGPVPPTVPPDLPPPDPSNRAGSDDRAVSVVIEEQRSERKPSNSADPEAPAVAADAPTPVDHPNPSLKSDPNPTQEGDPVDPADLSQGPETAQHPEQGEVVGWAQGGPESEVAKVAHPEPAGVTGGEAKPFEQDDMERRSAGDSAAEPDTVPDPDSPKPGNTVEDTTERSEDGPAEGVDQPAEESTDDESNEATDEPESDAQLQESEGGASDSSSEEEKQERTDSRPDGETRDRAETPPKGDAGPSPLSIQERMRQAVGAARNWANDTYIGRRLAGRPMEPWKSNRALHRSLDGERPAANAVVGNLRELKLGNPSIGYKDANAKRRSDEDLVNSVFAPRDGQYISTHTDRPGVIGQGNHRAMELLSRAEDPDNDEIQLTTPIFIHRVGEPEKAEEE